VITLILFYLEFGVRLYLLHEVIARAEALHSVCIYSSWHEERKRMNTTNMENNGESHSRSASFRMGFGLSVNEAKVHTVLHLGTPTLLHAHGDADVGDEERDKHQKPLTNSLSPRQMKSLVALCDTIIPSIDNNVVRSSDDESVANFYKTSASMAGTPQHVATFN